MGVLLISADSDVPVWGFNYFILFLEQCCISRAIGIMVWGLPFGSPGIFAVTNQPVRHELNLMFILLLQLACLSGPAHRSALVITAPSAGARLKEILKSLLLDN